MCNGLPARNHINSNMFIIAKARLCAYGSECDWSKTARYSPINADEQIANRPIVLRLIKGFDIQDCAPFSPSAQSCCNDYNGCLIVAT